jgi:flagellar basal body-associated protein FliL
VYLSVGLVTLLIGFILGSFLIRGGLEAKRNEPLYQKPSLSKRTLDLSPVVVNLLDNGEPGHYLRIQVQLVFRDEQALEYGKKMEPVIKDAIITHVTKLSYAKALSPIAKDHFKTEIKERLNRDLGGEPVEGALITEYIVE